MNKFEAHLAAKLFRASNPLPNFQPDYDKIRCVRNTNREEGRLVMFSGCFVIGRSKALLPFAVSFSDRDGFAAAMLGSFAFGDSRPPSRITAFLSVIDFLVETGELPLGALEEHTERACGGKGAAHKSGERKAVCDAYAEFSVRAAKDLPYDLSLEVLGQAA